MAYSAYVAATIDVTEVIWNHTGESQAAGKRLELILRVLTEAAQHTPGIQRSIAHLKHRLSQPRHHMSNLESGSTTPTTAHPSGVGQYRVSQDTVIDSVAIGAGGHGEYPCGLGLDELFATLLPEYTTTSDYQQPLSTADLPMLEEDWLADFGP